MQLKSTSVRQVTIVLELQHQSLPLAQLTNIIIFTNRPRLQPALVAQVVTNALKVLLCPKHVQQGKFVLELELLRRAQLANTQEVSLWRQHLNVKIAGQVIIAHLTQFSQYLVQKAHTIIWVVSQQLAIA